MLFLHGNESLGLRVPGYDRVVWNPDLWDELQRHPIQGLGHRQASLDENLSALDALGQVQARIWIDDGRVIFGGAIQRGVKDEVRAADRVPRLGEHVWNADAHRPAGASFVADRVRPQQRAGDPAGQVRHDFHLCPPGPDRRPVHQPDSRRILHGELERPSEQAVTLCDGGVITARQLVGHMVELGRRLVGLPKRTSQSPGREEEIEVAGFVSNDHHDLPAASVQVPLSPRRVGPAPDRTEFRGGPQAPFDREPQVFQQSRDVLPNELSLILGANEER